MRQGWRGCPGTARAREALDTAEGRPATCGPMAAKAEPPQRRECDRDQGPQELGAAEARPLRRGSRGVVTVSHATTITATNVMMANILNARHWNAMNKCVTLTIFSARWGNSNLLRSWVN